LTTPSSPNGSFTTSDLNWPPIESNLNSTDAQDPHHQEACRNSHWATLRRDEPEDLPVKGFEVTLVAGRTDNKKGMHSREKSTPPRQPRGGEGCNYNAPKESEKSDLKTGKGVAGFRTCKWGFRQSLEAKRTRRKRRSSSTPRTNPN